MRLASLCVLSYERPELLHACLESIRDGRADFELIVHDDGSEDERVRTLLWDLHSKGGISHLMMQAPGQNEGVGEAVRKCFAVAQGDLLVKVDQDLVFTEGWLEQTRKILESQEVGAVGSFAYHHDPVDVAKTTLEQRDGYFTVEDFVGSSFAIPRHVYEDPRVGRIEAHSPAFSEDVGLKDRIRKAGWELALPDDNVALNVGFGIGPSTVNVAVDKVRTISDGPLTFDGRWS